MLKYTCPKKIKMYLFFHKKIIIVFIVFNIFFSKNPEEVSFLHPALFEFEVKVGCFVSNPFYTLYFF